MHEIEQLQQQADQFRASGMLGKPGALSRLFDYLLTRSLTGEAPKEIEIALQVFAKSSAFDVSQDSVVRVYVHKLRRRLDEFYERLTPPSPARLVIPKGEYRLTIEQQVAEAVEVPIVQGAVPDVVCARPTRSRWQIWTAAIVGVLLAVAAGALVTAQLLGGREALEMRSVRHSALWAPLLEDDRPITIVVGDYYLMGETDAANKVRRLVREFHINSNADFMYHTELNPELMGRYRNMDLSYLPASTASALQNLAPILAVKKNVRVALMSELEGTTLKTSHIIYVGYISGMGMLGDTVFAGSRLSPGSTFDELVDAGSKATYVSKGAGTLSGDSRYTDYGYLSTFPGPAGNRIVILAGTRDTGVMHSAEAATHAAVINEISQQAGASTSFESLHEVHGVAKASISARRVFAAPLKVERFWGND